MAGYIEEESLYDDDDLDELPPHTLTELENNAIKLTQAHTQSAPSSDYGDDFDDEELDDAVVVDESINNSALIPVFRRSISRDSMRQQQRYHDQQQHRSQSYGEADTTFNLRSQQRQRIPRISSQPIHYPSQIPIAQHDLQVAEQGSQAFGVDFHVEILQKQIAELLKERTTLKEDLKAKIGEIAIVRSKQEKTTKEFEREIAEIQKQNEDKLAKQQKALDAARLSEKNAATEREFIRMDLAEESERVRRLNKAKEAEKKAGLGLTTPRKKKTQPHRDGFDDDEMETLSPSGVSPSRLQKRLVNSPKPAKRKRKVVPSPANQVGVAAPEEPLALQPELKSRILDHLILAKLEIKDDRFDFIRDTIEHSVDGFHLRTIQELDKYALPSKPEETLQTVILDKLPELGIKMPFQDLPIDFSKLLISLWTSCVSEEYFKPTYLLIDMLSFILEVRTSSLAPYIIDELLPIAQRTADFVAIPRFKSDTTEKYSQDVNLSACMSLLYLASLGCMSSPEHITRFWKLMRWDFVLLMLSTNQERADYDMIVRLLSTSIMKDSLGTLPGGDIQHLHTGYIIDRLTYPLSEHPCVPMSTEKFDTRDLNHVRLEIIHLMTSMTRSPYASKALATHSAVIGRLVCLISDELDVLYDYKFGHEESSRIISLATRLLYHLVTKYETIIDMPEKLAAIHGGSQKYLLCLSRLNFSEEGLVLESGIDLDVAAFALELLELRVTPEEGDAIQSAFSSQ